MGVLLNVVRPQSLASHQGDQTEGAHEGEAAQARKVTSQRGISLERETGLEPATLSLGSRKGTKK